MGRAGRTDSAGLGWGGGGLSEPPRSGTRRHRSDPEVERLGVKGARHVTPTRRLEVRTPTIRVRRDREWRRPEDRHECRVEGCSTGPSVVPRDSEAQWGQPEPGTWVSRENPDFEVPGRSGRVRTTSRLASTRTWGCTIASVCVRCGTTRVEGSSVSR